MENLEEIEKRLRELPARSPERQRFKAITYALRYGSSPEKLKEMLHEPHKEPKERVEQTTEVVQADNAETPKGHGSGGP